MIFSKIITALWSQSYSYTLFNFFVNLQLTWSLIGGEEKMINNGSSLMTAWHEYNLPLCCLVSDEMMNTSLYTAAVPLMIFMAVTLSALLTSAAKPSAYHTISTVLDIPCTATIVHSSVTGWPVVKLLGAALMLTFGVGTMYNNKIAL